LNATCRLCGVRGHGELRCPEKLCKEKRLEIAAADAEKAAAEINTAPLSRSELDSMNWATKLLQSLPLEQQTRIVNEKAAVPIRLSSSSLPPPVPSPAPARTTQKSFSSTLSLKKSSTETKNVITAASTRGKITPPHPLPPSSSKKEKEDIVCLAMGDYIRLKNTALPNDEKNEKLAAKLGPLWYWIVQGVAEFDTPEAKKLREDDEFLDTELEKRQHAELSRMRSMREDFILAERNILDEDEFSLWLQKFENEEELLFQSEFAERCEEMQKASEMQKSIRKTWMKLKNHSLSL